MFQTLARHKVVANKVKNWPKICRAQVGLAQIHQAPDKVQARTGPGPADLENPLPSHGPRMVGPGPGLGLQAGLGFRGGLVQNLHSKLFIF